MTFRFHFRLVKESEKERIHQWLNQEHIKLWLNGPGLDNTLQDLMCSFVGKSNFKHWLAFDHDIPFAYLLTSHINKEPAAGDDLASYCQKEGDAITLDLFICDLDYLGKGFAVQMIQEFLTQHFPHVVEVIIGPEIANERAVHVYKKAGFKIIKEYTPSWNPVPHFLMLLAK